jgi:capsid protein
MKPSRILDQHGRQVLWSNYYQGVGQSRERTYLPAVVGDSSQTLTRYNRTESLGLSRFLCANMGIFRAPIDDMALYAVGPGLTPKSQIENDYLAAIHEAYFGAWAEQADLSGQHTFGQIQGLACKAVDRDGDIGFNMYAPGASEIGQLQIIEGHRIEGDDDGFIDGVKSDPKGQPIQYRVKTGKTYIDLDAGNFILLHEPDRADQRRGITSMAHALAHTRDILDTLGYEKIGIKMASAIGLAIKTQTGMQDTGTGFVENGFRATDTGGLPWETFQAGMIPRLKVGESIDSFQSDRPGEAFMRFVDFLIRDIAVGMGLPFEFVWDVASAKGSGSRFILAKAQRRFEQRQALLINRFLNRVYRWVIAKGIKRKEIPAAPFWWLVKWNTPAKPTVDMGREAQANRDDLKYGNRTLQEDAGERGEDWRDIRVQKEIESRDLLDRAMKLVDYSKGQLTLEKALFMLSADGPNAPQIPASNPQVDPELGKKK